MQKVVQKERILFFVKSVSGESSHFCTQMTQQVEMTHKQLFNSHFFYKSLIFKTKNIYLMKLMCCLDRIQKCLYSSMHKVIHRKVAPYNNIQSLWITLWVRWV